MTAARPHDAWLDSLLARIERDRRTATGQEMYARADARSAAERERIRVAHPLDCGAPLGRRENAEVANA